MVRTHPTRAALGAVRLAVCAMLLAVGSGAAAGEGPVEVRGHSCLLADRTEHDFGVAGQNARVDTTFTITNDSTRKVEGIRVKPGCGCNVVELDKDVLEPGQSATLKVGFETGILSGKLLKTVRISSRKSSQGEIRLRLRIGVLAGVVLEPGAITFKDARHGTRPSTSFLVRWYEGVGDPFEIQAVEIPGHEEAFATRVEKLTATKDELWRGYRVHLGFKEPPPLGKYSAEMIVRTNDEKSPRLVLPIFANVVGQVWLQSQTIHFGIVEAGSTRQASLKFRPADKDVAFGEVSAESSDPRIEVSVKRDPFFQAERYWILTARIKEGATAGRLDEAVIKLHTGAKGEEVSEIRVQGTVRERRG